MGAGRAQEAALAFAKAIVVDPSKPAGSIKVKFLDGSMVNEFPLSFLFFFFFLLIVFIHELATAVVKANHDHTVGDLKNHVESQKPCKKAFLLSIQSTGQSLTDLGINLKDSGVIGAMVVQSI
jgi:hypothetical protein